eukprot:CCRYP_008303-RA/>CCRYP_008303-RA protein AED:0.41 eAED:0.41 QI:0/-1/0/1/-1/1/1/0/62
MSSLYCMNKAYSTAKKMGIIHTCHDAEKAYESKKVIGRLFYELADDPLSKTEKEKRPQSHSP